MKWTLTMTKCHQEEDSDLEIGFRGDEEESEDETDEHQEKGSKKGRKKGMKREPTSNPKAGSAKAEPDGRSEQK